MLAACRLAGLSALDVQYAGVGAHAQMLDRLAAMRGPGESYSDLILRLVGWAATGARPQAFGTGRARASLGEQERLDREMRFGPPDAPRDPYSVCAGGARSALILARSFSGAAGQR
jgi:hypothetical protein